MTKRIILDSIMDICDALHKCLIFTKDMKLDQFLKDEKTQFAVIRALEVAGEAAKNIPDTVRNKYPDIPWKEMAGMRDVLIHQYFGVDHSVIWKTIQKDIKEILPIFSGMLEEIEKEDFTPYQ